MYLAETLHVRPHLQVGDSTLWGDIAWARLFRRGLIWARKGKHGWWIVNLTDAGLLACAKLRLAGRLGTPVERLPGRFFDRQLLKLALPIVIKRPP
jgi:hypothetical protein